MLLLLLCCCYCCLLTRPAARSLRLLLRSGITWMTKDGLQKPNYFGSLTQAATVRRRPRPAYLRCC